MPAIQRLSLRELHNSLFKAEPSLWRFALRAGLIGFVPALLALVTICGLLSAIGIDPKSFPHKEYQPTWETFFLMVILAPAFETLLLAFLLVLLRLASKNAAFVLLCSSLLWGAVHGADIWIRFFDSTWAFYVFSRAYTTWRPVSFTNAFLAAAIPHALMNSVAFMLLFID